MPHWFHNFPSNPPPALPMAEFGVLKTILNWNNDHKLPIKLIELVQAIGDHPKAIDAFTRLYNAHFINISGPKAENFGEVLRRPFGIPCSTIMTEFLREAQETALRRQNGDTVDLATHLNIASPQLSVCTVTSSSEGSRYNDRSNRPGTERLKTGVMPNNLD